MRFLALAALAALFAAQAAAAPADNSIDELFAKLARVSSSEDAKPIEKEIVAQFLQSGSPTVDLLMTRVDALAEAGDTATAAKILDDVTKIAPTYAEGWHHRGILEADTGQDAAAMVSLQKTVNLNPREFQALMELGDMLAQYGAKPAALATYKRAFALDPHLEGLDKRVEQLSRDVEGNKI